MKPQPVQAQAAAARLEGDEKSIITVQFPVSNDNVITAMQGVQAVMEAVELDRTQLDMLTKWLTTKMNGYGPPVTGKGLSSPLGQGLGQGLWSSVTGNLSGGNNITLSQL